VECLAFRSAVAQFHALLDSFKPVGATPVDVFPRVLIIIFQQVTCKSNSMMLVRNTGTPLKIEYGLAHWLPQALDCG
jgi:hypothetical protein